MGVVIRQSLWSTVIAYVGVLVGYVNTLYLRPEFFEMDEIGLFGLITANAMMISPFSSFGMSSSYIKFFPSFKESQRNRFFTFQFVIVVLGFTIIALCGYLLRDLIRERYVETAPEYINYLSITAIIILANSLFDLFFSYSRAIMKVLFPSFLRDVFLRLGAIVLVTGYALEWFSFEWAVNGLAINYALAVIFLYAQLAIGGFRFDFTFTGISAEFKKKLLKFALYSMFLAGSFAIINNATYDQVTSVLGAKATGIFITCFFIGTIVEMPRRNMAKVVSPIISNEFQNNNLAEVGILYKRSSITMSVLGALLFIGIATNLKDLFSFIPQGDQFQNGLLVVIAVCLAKLSIMISSFPGEIINFSPLYRYNLYFQLGTAVLLVVLNYLLIPAYGLNGAGLSYLLAIVIHVIVKIAFVRRHFQIHPFTRTHFGLVIITLLTGVLAWNWEPSFHPVMNIAIRSIATVTVFIPTIYLFRISDDINKLIRSTFERFLKIKLPK